MEIVRSTLYFSIPLIYFWVLYFTLYLLLQPMEESLLCIPAWWNYILKNIKSSFLKNRVMWIECFGFGYILPELCRGMVLAGSPLCLPPRTIMSQEAVEWTNNKSILSLWETAIGCYFCNYLWIRRIIVNNTINHSPQSVMVLYAM